MSRLTILIIQSGIEKILREELRDVLYPLPQPIAFHFQPTLLTLPTHPTPAFGHVSF